MNTVTLNLVVLRSSDLERAAEFYGLLGVDFQRHRHGDGPEHLAAELPGAVFELYPLSAGAASTSAARIGFSVSSVDMILAKLHNRPETILTPAKESQWGRRAVVIDPDGHRVELTESLEAQERQTECA